MAGYGLRGYGLDGYGISAQIFDRAVDEKLILFDSDIKDFEKDLDESVLAQTRLDKSAFLVRSETTPIQDNLLNKVATFVKPAEQFSVIDNEQFVLQTDKQENLSAVDEQKVSLSKPLDESQQIQDDLAFTLSAPKQVALTITDELAEKALFKPLRETPEVRDQFDREVEYFRNFDPNILIQDSDILDLSIPFIESASLADDARTLTAKQKKESIGVTAQIPLRRVFLEFEESATPEDVLRFKLDRTLEPEVNFSQFVQLRKGLDVRFQEGLNPRPKDVEFKLEKPLSQPIELSDQFDRVFEGFRGLTQSVIVDIPLPLLGGSAVINLRKVFEDSPNKVEPAGGNFNEVEQR
jgi:hypothetical protein